MTAQPTRDQLRALADAATEGPWEAGRIRPLSGPDYYGVTAGDEIVASLDMAPDMSGPQASMDSDFIAAARTAVPHLLDHLDQAEAELDSWMARAYEAEKRAWQAEKRIRHLEDTARVLVKEALNAEAERDSARGYISELETAVKSRNDVIKHRDARIKAVRDVLDTAILRDGTEEQELARRIRRALEG